MKIVVTGNMVLFEPENTYEAYRLGFLVGRSEDGDYGVSTSVKGNKTTELLSIRCEVDDIVKRLIKGICDEG